MRAQEPGGDRRIAVIPPRPRADEELERHRRAVLKRWMSTGAVVFFELAGVGSRRDQPATTTLKDVIGSVFGETPSYSSSVDSCVQLALRGRGALFLRISGRAPRSLARIAVATW